MNNLHKKPRLLVISSTYPRWAEDTEPSFVHQLASRLTNRFDVVVSTSRAPGSLSYEVIEHVQVHRYAYAFRSWETLVYGGGLIGNLRATPLKAALIPTYLSAWLLQVIKLHRENPFDVIHAHWLIPGGCIAILARLGIPICITAHGSDVLHLKGKLWQRVRRSIAARASAITAVGTRVHETLEGEGVSVTRLLPMGADLSTIFTPSMRATRAPRLIFVARLVDSKRPDLVLRIFSQVLKSHPEFHLDIVGNGPELSRLKAQASALKINNSIIFHGRKPQDEIARMYRSSTLAIITSGDEDAPEGLGLGAIEALGSECPVISAPNTALQQMLPKGAPIFFSENSSVDEMTKTTLRVLASGKITIESDKNKWREELVRKFSWESVSSDYGVLLESLANGPA